jgi:hypothetical protein
MRKLSAAVEKGAENDTVPGPYALTEADVHAYCVPAVATRTKPRRPFPHRPSVRSQFVWPRKS